MIKEYTRKLNAVLRVIAEKVKDLSIYRDLQYNCAGMGAFLVYKADQTRHIDTQNLMDMLAENRADSSLWMINLLVNAKKVVWNQKQDKYTFVSPDQGRPKVFCTEDDGKVTCHHGETCGRHLKCKTGTVVCATLPDVACAYHAPHDITGWTVVYTNRGLSQRTRMRGLGLLSMFRQKLGF